MSDYEGWKNKETWEVVLYVSNDRRLYKRTLDWMEGQTTIHSNSAKYFVCNNLPLCIPDHGINLDVVDWTEIADDLTTMNNEAHA
jgi:hypothetical protein